MTTDSGYVCTISLTYNEIKCNIDNAKLRYVINFYTTQANKITISCHAISTDTSDIYNKICQSETGKNGSCNNTYCRYDYN